MFISIPMLAAIGVVVAALLVIALRRRGSDRDLTGPPRHWSPPPSGHAPPAVGPRPAWLTPELEAELRALLPRHKIQAIKRVREASHMGLGEAKDFVERM